MNSLLQAIIVLQFLDNTPFTMVLYNGETYEYPREAIWIGYVIACSSVLMIPLMAVVALFNRRAKTASQVSAKATIHITFDAFKLGHGQHFRGCS